MDPSSQPEVVQAAISRRNFLRAAGLGATTLAFTSPLLAACSSSKKSAPAASTPASTTAAAAPSSAATTAAATSASAAPSGNPSSGTIKIGYVSPITGPAAGFGEPDGYVLGLARKAFAKGLTIDGKLWDVQIIDKDGQSDPARAAQVAQDLINGVEGRPDAHDVDPGAGQPGLRRLRGGRSAVRVDRCAVGSVVLRSGREAR